MVCGSSWREILSFGFFYTWLHSSHPFPTSVFMKTFPINLCRRELSTFPPSPAKDAVFLCDELVKDYPAEVFHFQVNLQNYSRSWFERDIGRTLGAPFCLQSLNHPGVAKPALGVPRRASQEWLWESAGLSPSELPALFWGWLVQFPRSPPDQNPPGTDHQHRILARIANSARWGCCQADFWLPDCSHMRVNGSSCGGGTKATSSPSAWEGPCGKISSHAQLCVLGWAASAQLSSYTQHVWSTWAWVSPVRGRLGVRSSLVMPIWAESLLGHSYHLKTFKELTSLYRGQK